MVKIQYTGVANRTVFDRYEGLRESVEFVQNQTRWISTQLARELLVDEAASWTLVEPASLLAASDVPNLMVTLAGTTDNNSGADAVGATPTTLGGAASTVQGILDALDTKVLPLAGGTLTGHLTMTTAKNIIIASTGAGTQIGTAANQKIALWGATPAVQRSHVADLLTNYAAGDVDTGAKIATILNLQNTAINAILASLEALGLHAAA